MRGSIQLMSPPGSNPVLSSTPPQLINDMREEIAVQQEQMRKLMNKVSPEKNQGKAAVVLADQTPTIGMAGDPSSKKFLMQGDIVYIEKELAAFDSQVLTLCHVWTDGQKEDFVVARDALGLVEDEESVEKEEDFYSNEVADSVVIRKMVEETSAEALLENVNDSLESRQLCQDKK